MHILGYLFAVLWIRIHWIRIRIQHFKWMQIRNPVQNPDTDPWFWWTKIEKIFFLFFSFLDHKLKFSYPWAPIKDVQTTRRSLQPSKKNIQHLKRWKLLTVFYFLGHFWPFGSRSLSRIRIRIHNQCWGSVTFWCVSWSGSVPLTNGSGSDSFLHWFEGCQIFFFFSYFILITWPQAGTSSSV
jgi:hypothetical protein